MRIMREAVGVITSNYLNNAIKDSKNICIGIDCNPDTVGRILCDEFYVVPQVTDLDKYALFMRDFLKEKKIDFIIPTLDDSMLMWSKNLHVFENNGTYIAISPEETIEIFSDKWKTYQFFVANGIPTPKTSLKQEYGLIKPRNGRGSKGIFVTDDVVNMEGNISQEIIEGTEYTIDVLCDMSGVPIYIVPRCRLGVQDGKSTGGIVVQNNQIEHWVRLICSKVLFKGPINIQCFITEDDKILFIEVNTRLGGGTALAFAATENWIPLMIDMFCQKKNPVTAQSVNYGLRMGRYYVEKYF